MSSPSAASKVNCLVVRYLYFRGVRGDLQEGNGCASRAKYLSSRCQSQSPRAQNRGFCAFLAFGDPIFWPFEHKIEVFVRFCPPEPPISGFLSTKLGFLCALDVGCCSSVGCDYSRGRCSDCGQGSGTDYNSGCGHG